MNLENTHAGLTRGEVRRIVNEELAARGIVPGKIVAREHVTHCRPRIELVDVPGTPEAACQLDAGIRILRGFIRRAKGLAQQEVDAADAVLTAMECWIGTVGERENACR